MICRKLSLAILLALLTSAANAEADLTGIYQAALPGATPDKPVYLVIERKPRSLTQTADGEPIPFQPWTKAEFDRINKEHEAGHEPIGYDPYVSCLPPGVSMSGSPPFPIQFIQRPEIIAIAAETHSLFRFVHMNVDHPKNVKPSWMGHSVGRWDDATLVVDTVGQNDKTLLSRIGIRHSDSMRMIERISLSEDGRVLTNEITVDDPVAYTKPWRIVRRYFRLAEGTELMESVCAQNNREAEHAGESER
jgi:hypothetical protein